MDGDVMPLPVGAAFHSDLVRPVALEMAPLLEATAGNDPKLPIVSSTRAAVVESWSELKAALIEQITAPVLWQQTLRLLRETGFDTFVEIGPGRVLTGFVRKTLSGVRAISVADLAGVRAARQALAGADA
jgi:[acyl-carrier-protein] S-malonyltransferase